MPVPRQYVLNVRKLAERLQIVRDALRNPLTIISGGGWRTSELNAALPGTALRSAHLVGRAADLRSPGIVIEDVFDLFLRLIETKKIPDGGLHLYPEVHNRFIHYDTRRPRRW